MKLPPTAHTITTTTNVFWKLESQRNNVCVCAWLEREETRTTKPNISNTAHRIQFGYNKAPTPIS